jgi:hypothetical protein
METCNPNLAHYDLAAMPKSLSKHLPQLQSKESWSFNSRAVL